MDYLFDLSLLVISGCSAIYCWNLSRRLRALQNLRSGMGQALVNLTKSVTAVETNAAKLNRETASSVAELRSMMANIDAAESKVDILLETMDRQARETWKDHRTKVESTRSQIAEASAEFEGLMKDARSLASLMNEQLIALTRTADRIETMSRDVKTAPRASAAAVQTAVPTIDRPVHRAAAQTKMPAKAAAPAVSATAAKSIADAAAAADIAKPAAAKAPTPKAPVIDLPKPAAQPQPAAAAAKVAEKKTGENVADLVAASKAKQQALAKAVARAANLVAEDGQGADPRIAALARKIAAKSGAEAAAASAPTPRRPRAANPFNERPAKQA
ncbi:hypothetical protein [Parvularcula sp. LCG005]|uniref:hypothetical protein n=1 Tax=Parvularcula sp. LCG005 TaxID=3078805 RepID=UPI00294234ED|nr:hypothetical protein [Parvularcula sp. LCG005]WOI52695.1 hypothetical protein RUI03_11110 [Parvularcula sp. LCG005]